MPYFSLYNIETMVHDYSHALSCKYPFKHLAKYRIQETAFTSLLPWTVQKWRQDCTIGKMNINKSWQSHCLSLLTIALYNNLISLLPHFTNDCPYLDDTIQASYLLLSHSQIFHIYYKEKEVSIEEIFSIYNKNI